jgi:hypothetical protein
MVDFFRNMQSQFNTAMTPQNQSNNFYDFMVKQYGLTDNGELNLGLDLGNKEDAPKVVEAILKYNNQEPEEGAIMRMMNNPGFIMGLSLMNQAAGGKGVGEALLPAAQTTQGFIANQELTKQNKKLMRMKDSGQIIEVNKAMAELQQTRAGTQQTVAQTENIKSQTVLNDLKKPLLENEALMGMKNITLAQLNIDQKQDEATVRLATFNSIEANENLTESQKLFYANNPGQYGSIDDSIAFKSTQTTDAMVEKIVGSKIMKDLVEFVPGVDSSDREAARADIKADIARKATELARIAYTGGERKTPDVTKADVDAAYAEMVTSGKVEKREWWRSLLGGRLWGGGVTVNNALGGTVEANKPIVVGEEGPEVFVPQQPGAIVSNPATKGGYTWENAIIDNSPELKRIAQSSGVAEAKKALKKFRPDLYV